MALLIPDFAPTEKFPESKEEWQEIYCELVTPLHGGGVVARESDDKLPVRVTAIRGQLRFWWRLLAQQKWNLCKPPPTFALCCSNFCTLGFVKVSAAFALYRMMRNKKSDATVAFYFTNYIRPILHWFYQFYFFRPYKPIQVE